jgi:hypothetical protein
VRVYSRAPRTNVRGTLKRESAKVGSGATSKVGDRAFSDLDGRPACAACLL